jgi:hypothetical protein
LLNQSVAPDKVLLWIAISDFDSLPREVLALTAYGLQIEVCEDLKSYNKIIPALAKFNDAYIATADDDVFYWRSWLKELVGAVRPAIKEVVCHRAHRIRLAANGLPLPYLRWAWNTRRRIAHPLNFPTGHAGVLYPPGIFHADVMNVDQIKALCPTADDVWLFWMASRGGASFRKVGRRRAMVTWLGSQERNLYEQNISQGGNDSQIQRMIRTYGFPPKSG